jgi:DNA-binding LacI/PurR family transcriptional regulator
VNENWALEKTMSGVVLVKDMTDAANPALFAPRRVTLMQVAARVGLHYSTVSLALRGAPRIPAATVARVRAAADELGYVPDPVLGALIAHRYRREQDGKHQVIAWLVYRKTGQTGWDTVRLYREYFRGAEERAKMLGCKLEVFTCADVGMTPARVSEILKARGITLVIVCPLALPGEIPGFEWGRFFPVMIGLSLLAPALHRVTSDAFQTVWLALEALKTLGYRKIGYAIPYPAASPVGKIMQAAYRQFQTERNLAGERELPIFVFPRRYWVEFKTWQRRWRADVILADHAGYPDFFPRLRREYAGKLGFASITLAQEETGIAGVYQKNYQVGAAAVDLTLALQNRNERGVPAEWQKVLIAPEWRAGKTTQRAARAARMTKD